MKVRLYVVKPERSTNAKVRSNLSSYGFSSIISQRPNHEATLIEVNVLRFLGINPSTILNNHRIGRLSNQRGGVLNSFFACVNSSPFPFNLEKKTEAQKEKKGEYPDIHSKSSDLSCFIDAKSFYPDTSNRIQGEIHDEKHSGSQLLHSVNFDQHQNNHKVP